MLSKFSDAILTRTLLKKTWEGATTGTSCRICCMPVCKSGRSVASGSHSHQLLRCQSYERILSPAGPSCALNTKYVRSQSLEYSSPARLATCDPMWDCETRKTPAWSCRKMSPNWEILTSAAWTQCTTEIVTTWTRSIWKILRKCSKLVGVRSSFAQRILSHQNQNPSKGATCATIRLHQSNRFLFLASNVS